MPTFEIGIALGTLRRAGVGRCWHTRLRCSPLPALCRHVSPSEELRPDGARLSGKTKPRIGGELGRQRVCCGSEADSGDFRQFNPRLSRVGVFPDRGRQDIHRGQCVQVESGEAGHVHDGHLVGPVRAERRGSASDRRGLPGTRRPALELGTARSSGDRPGRRSQP